MFPFGTSGLREFLRPILLRKVFDPHRRQYACIPDEHKPALTILQEARVTSLEDVVSLTKSDLEVQPQQQFVLLLLTLPNVQESGAKIVPCNKILQAIEQLKSDRRQKDVVQPSPVHKKYSFIPIPWQRIFLFTTSGNLLVGVHWTASFNQV